MRKTKIVCTLGPSTDKDGILRQLIENGMMWPVSIFPTAIMTSIAAVSSSCAL